MAMKMAGRTCNGGGLAGGVAVNGGGIHFDDLFTVKDVDPDGKKFERVSRLHCTSESFQQMELILDVHTQLHPLQINDTFRLMICETLREDGLTDEGEYDRACEQINRCKMFDYVMCGRLYRVEHAAGSAADASRLSAYASFGGLLMRIQGEANSLTGFEVGKTVYLLLKKV